MRVSRDLKERTHCGVHKGNMKHSEHLTQLSVRRISETIRLVPDFPKPGIQFRDVMPALADPVTFHLIVEAMCAPHLGRQRPDVIVGIESRGFIFGAAMAQRLDVAFVPVRKAGKLPGDVDRIQYALEYGMATVELQKGIIRRGQRVAVVDDLLATGGTARAAATLVTMQRAEVISFDFVVTLEDLEGAASITSTNPELVLADFNSVITY